MNVSRFDFNQLLFNEGILRTDEEMASLLHDAASSHEIAELLIVTLLANHSSTEAEGASVCKSMKTLEEFAERFEPLACILMSHLWIISNKLQMHDMCDSIDLWLSNCKSPDLRHHLLLLAKFQADAGIRQHFEQLAA